MSKLLLIVLPIVSVLSYAQKPVVIEGAVPNEAAKQEILNKAYMMYGHENVVDKIQVRTVAAPNGWSSNVSNMIGDDLKKVQQGQLSVRGTHVNLTGKITNPQEIQQTSARMQSLVPSTFKVNTQLTVNAAEQQIIDAALKNRIIEFESGSAVLAPSGMQILNEMAVAVKNYLVSKSIAADSMSAEGLGSNKPVADNATPDGRKKNRRIEFEVL